MIFVLFLISISAYAAAEGCDCVDGPLPVSVAAQFEAYNYGTTALLGVVREIYRIATPCYRRLLMDTFLLTVSWEASHIAFGRYIDREPRQEKYFLYPTHCAGVACIDFRVDWLKNAVFDAAWLYVVGIAELHHGIKPSSGRFLWLQEVLGNVQELVVDETSNGITWTYCPTSYNPIAPWGEGSHPNNDTILPQLVWVDLPKKFTDSARELNCSGNFEFPTLVQNAVSKAIAIASSDNHRHSVNLSKPLNCSLSKAILDLAYSSVFESADALVEYLAAHRSPDVLQAFQSAPAPIGTQLGLEKIFSNVNRRDFRAKAMAIWDALIGEVIV